MFQVEITELIEQVKLLRQEFELVKQHIFEIICPSCWGSGNDGMQFFICNLADPHNPETSRKNWENYEAHKCKNCKGKGNIKVVKASMIWGEND